MTSKFTVKVA